MNTRNITLIFGITFILVGVIGFIPNPLVAPNGLFAVNAVHNLIHIVLGSAFLLGAARFKGREDKVLKFFGLGGLAVTAVGFLTRGDMMLGIIHVNPADHWLHLGLGLVVLAAGFVFPTVAAERIERVRTTAGSH